MATESGVDQNPGGASMKQAPVSFGLGPVLVVRQPLCTGAGVRCKGSGCSEPPLPVVGAAVRDDSLRIEAVSFPEPAC